MRPLDRERDAGAGADPGHDGDGCSAAGGDDLRRGGSPRTDGRLASVPAHSGSCMRFTHGWPQRPGWRCPTAFCTPGPGQGRPGAIAAEAVVRCRAAWARPPPHDVRRTSRPRPGQHPHDRGSRRDHRLGDVARRRPRPRPGPAAQRRRSRRRRVRHTPRKRGPHRKRPLLGPQRERPVRGAGGSPKFRRSEQQRSTERPDAARSHIQCNDPLGDLVGATPPPRTIAARPPR